MFSMSCSRRSTLLLALTLSWLSFLDGAAVAATLTVTSTADSGAGSLRQAIADAAAGDTVVFTLPAPSTIALLTGPVVINKSLTISGPGVDLLSVKNLNPNIGNNRVPVFSIAAGDFDVVISGLTVSRGMAGGIVSAARTVTLSRLAVSGNSAHNRGPGGISNTGTMLIIDSVISGNASTGPFSSAGGIANNGTLTIINSTISGNSSQNGEGGGIWTATRSSSDAPPPTGSLHLTNCTIVNNSALFGGGIYISDGSTARATNTIVAGNSGYFEGPDIRGTLVSEGNNFIGNNSDATITPATGDQIGTAAAPRDPLLGPLQYNGGPTQTHALLAGSTAIDAGDDSVAPPRDQRDYLRSGPSDIGSFEFAGTIPVTLANISTRVEIGADGDSVLIAGFIITGTQPKKLLVRGLGPSMPVTGKLADPILDLHDSTQSIASNDNWRTNSNAQEIEAVGLAPEQDLEAALLITLSPGAYTVIVGRADGSSPGIGLVEVYDLDRTSGSKLANISSRGWVQTGDKVMIAGVIVRGADAQKVLVRALGPSVPVNPRLLDPLLQLHDGNGALLASNDNWRSDQEAEITATGIAPPNEAESAIVRTLPPALYTAIVCGVSETNGIALVEVYALR